MIILIIGLLLLASVCVSVKLFDEYIRPKYILKVLINTSTFVGMLMVIVGMVLLFIK